MGDGLFLLQIWKWPETYAVRLIYCVAFTEMMKQSLALTIYRRTDPLTLTCSCADTLTLRDTKNVLPMGDILCCLSGVWIQRFCPTGQL